jgi:hypothetical protein
VGDCCADTMLLMLKASITNSDFILISLIDDDTHQTFQNGICYRKNLVFIKGKTTLTLFPDFNK